MKVVRHMEKLLKGKTTIAFRGFLYKFVVSRANIPQLQREGSYSNLAESSTLFTGHVATAESLSPRVIRYPLVSTNSAISEKVEAMILFCRQKTAHIQNCPRGKANGILENYCISLGIDWWHFCERNNVDLEQLLFDLPVSFMHGDFAPINAGFRGNQLVMFDWEFAYEKGSLLYDCWYLQHICNYLQYAESLKAKTGEFLAITIAEYKLEPDSFMYFCNVMNGVQCCKR
jgi:hypothetical protein